MSYGPSPDLISQLDHSLREWDDAYTQVLQDFLDRDMKPTEERLRVATRNEMRQRSVELPEIVRWRLRMKIGYREEEGQ